VAADIIASYNSAAAKLDSIISRRANTPEVGRRDAVEALLFAFFRNKTRIEASFSRLCEKKPKDKLFAALCAAAADLISSSDQKRAKVVHSWIEFVKKNFSKGEAGFANAVLRKFPDEFLKFDSLAEDAAGLSLKYSHPKWLVEKWISVFGQEKTIEILKINQKPSEVFFRKSSAETTEDFSEFLIPSSFDGFFRLKSGAWAKAEKFLEGGEFYIQDPSTSFAVSALGIEAGKTYLDLCAAPGGKSRLIADTARKLNPLSVSQTLLVSVDLKDREEILRKNMAKADFLKSSVISCDLIKEDLSEKLKSLSLPSEFDFVFVDAPCSNTGVLRRRPDARFRISPDDILKCSQIQLQILESAKKFVKKGGKFVYSTCSIEPEENMVNAKSFVEKNRDFSLIFSKSVLPETENDGAGYSLFERL